MLTTLKKIKDYLEIDKDDTAQDENLTQWILGVSDEIESYTRRQLSTEFVTPEKATEDNPRSLPYDIENACIELVAIDYQRKGSEHLKTEVVGPLRSDFIADMPDHIKSILDRYKEYFLA